MNKGLGRLKEFDERSRAFPIRALIPVTVKPRSYTWSCPITLDQGREGACVGFSFSHEAAARPAKVKNVNNRIAMEVYRRAQALDDYPDSTEGTSVLAGVKACIERKWYGSYRWGFGLEDVILALGYKGPVVLGINWYEDMGAPDRSGIIHIGPGEPVGGHAIVATGVQVKNKFVRLHNSWGDDWGQNGDCLISFDDLDRLLHEQGEACVPLGRRV